MALEPGLVDSPPTSIILAPDLKRFQNESIALHLVIRVKFLRSFFLKFCGFNKGIRVNSKYGKHLIIHMDLEFFKAQLFF